MSLSALTYKYIGKFTAPASTTSGTMAALATAFSSATYADGSSRVTGSGVAWTPFSQVSVGTTVAVSLTPVTSTLGQKVLFAGGGSGSPTMISPDVYASTGRIYFGLCKNAGSFNSWVNANPYSAGQFSGFTGFYALSAYFHVFESQDSVCVVGETAAGVMTHCMAGAIIDPESSNASAAESDGKIYALTTTGFSGGGTISNTYTGSPNTFFLNYGVSNGQVHAYIMNFGASTTTDIRRINYDNLGTTINSFKNSANEFVKLPIFPVLTYKLKV